MKKIAKSLAILLILCLLLTSCAPAPQQPAGNSEAQKAISSGDRLY